MPSGQQVALVGKKSEWGLGDMGGHSQVSSAMCQLLRPFQKAH
jgi:hypothetical protein